ncbi:MAG TPA: ABC transporter permease [Arenicellales bacterium]|jgi:peptide/nickel transport system permease protein|nr:peptide ABC transporter [Gammaproteobacteria bacterium]MDP6024321.1 ABC transporter permease [Pseudomonadales bacterium]MDP7316505.1 ABC transporter permease [Pseudomonadales bacterium]HJL52341.1 ABC transporter permease [Arenicellales bacterium]HJP52123.1 ABC transporter permease [Pseudomonadales bacterium]|tara:strand:- start:18 stop:968 length:951 start_codon:yes stop_codon:yes gene_type:complete
MWSYVVRRLLQMIPVLAIITFIVYALMFAIPGDPARALVGPGESLDEEQLEIIRKEHNLDKPVIVQYGLWLTRALRGDFGRSTQNYRPVAEELKDRVQVTLQFGIVAWLLAVLIGVPAGIVSAVYRGKPVDFIATVLSIAGVAIPNFWLGIMSILLFGVILGWLPTQGYVDIFEDPAEGFRHMILPAFALGITSWALIMRQSRSAMLEVLTQDYVRTARAKGMRPRSVVWVHALRNALLPVVTVFGLQTGRIFAGAVVIETLFGIPGMGQFMIQAIFARDFQSVQGAVLLMALAVLFANLITDLVYAWLDPRIRYT